MEKKKDKIAIKKKIPLQEKECGMDGPSIMSSYYPLVQSVYSAPRAKGRKVKPGSLGHRCPKPFEFEQTRRRHH